MEHDQELIDKLKEDKIGLLRQVSSLETDLAATQKELVVRFQMVEDERKRRVRAEVAARGLESGFAATVFSLRAELLKAKTEIEKLNNIIHGEMADPNGCIWEAHSVALKRAELAEQERDAWKADVMELRKHRDFTQEAGNAS